MIPCLSIRQPWAWFIVHGWKPIENRNWFPPGEMVGRWILIHAAKGGSRREFDEAIEFAGNAGAGLAPDFDRVPRGGIVGSVKLSRVVTASPSKWFVGRFGWVLTNPYPLPLFPCRGQQGLFYADFVQGPAQVADDAGLPKAP